MSISSPRSSSVGRPRFACVRSGGTANGSSAISMSSPTLWCRDELTIDDDCRAALRRAGAGRRRDRSVHPEAALWMSVLGIVGPALVVAGLAIASHAVSEMLDLRRENMSAMLDPPRRQ